MMISANVKVIANVLLQHRVDGVNLSEQQIFDIAAELEPEDGLTVDELFVLFDLISELEPCTDIAEAEKLAEKYGLTIANTPR